MLEVLLISHHLHVGLAQLCIVSCGNWIHCRNSDIRLLRCTEQQELTAVHVRQKHSMFGMTIVPTVVDSMMFFLDVAERSMCLKVVAMVLTMPVSLPFGKGTDVVKAIATALMHMDMSTTLCSDALAVRKCFWTWSTVAQPQGCGDGSSSACFTCVYRRVHRSVRPALVLLACLYASNCNLSVISCCCHARAAYKTLPVAAATCGGTSLSLRRYVPGG